MHHGQRRSLSEEVDLFTVELACWNAETFERTADQKILCLALSTPHQGISPMFSNKA